MQAVKDASALYEVERRAIHAERPGFRITELQIGPKQKVPWHCHSKGAARAGRDLLGRAQAPASRHQCGR